MTDLNDRILVVDLDGTLLRSDMLFESFWSAVGRDWRTLFGSIKTLLTGRAGLKRYLASRADIDPETLPYDQTTLEYIETWRDGGGRVALVTASDEIYAKTVGDTLGVFDEVHGSDGVINLKGQNKADFLIQRFGEKNFDYMGDSAADVPIWEKSAKAITVNASDTVRRQADRVADTADHIGTKERPFAAYLKALRPHQWLKNMLVFVPTIAAHDLSIQALFLAVLAFISFSMIASSVYLINDLIDLKADRLHPRKKNRPFAAGKIPLAHGLWLAAFLILAGGLLAFSISLQFVGIIIGYYALTTGYSLRLKRLVVIDICVLAGLYTIRIIAGGIATQTELSFWLFAFSIFIFLSLAAVKRQAELVDIVKRGKENISGRGYNTDDLPVISMIALAAGYVSVMVISLYIHSPEVIELYSEPKTLWAISAILLFWITRTVMLTHRGMMHDDPVVFAVKDRVSQYCGLLMGAFALAGTVL